MSDVAPELADIDAALAKGEWWLRILDELAEGGVALARQLAGDVKAGCRRAEDAADDYVRVAAAVREAVAMSVRLEQALRGLRSLRACPRDQIRAAMATAAAETTAAEATAESAARANARAKAGAQAKERRETRKAKVRELVTEAIDHDAADEEDHENLCLALEERLSFDPAYTDIDSLPLRETVESICADLDITPDWSRWEAEDWNRPKPRFDGPWPPPRPGDPHELVVAETPAPIRPPALVPLE
jgi:hypothetical protein